MSSKTYQPELFREALQATAEHRGSMEILKDHSAIISRLESSENLKQQWVRYQRQFPYAAQIDYHELIKSLYGILGQK